MHHCSIRTGPVIGEMGHFAMLKALHASCHGMGWPTAGHGGDGLAWPGTYSLSLGMHVDTSLMDTHIAFLVDQALLRPPLKRCLHAPVTDTPPVCHG